MVDFKSITNYNTAHTKLNIPSVEPFNIHIINHVWQDGLSWFNVI